MNRYYKFGVLAIFALLLFAPLASARPPGFGFGAHFGPGPVFIGPAFYYGYGAGWYGAWVVWSWVLRARLV